MELERNRPSELLEYAQQAPGRMRSIADDPDTPVKLKAEIEKWFFETYFGKGPSDDADISGGDIRSLDLSRFSDAELLAMIEESDD